MTHLVAQELASLQQQTDHKGTFWVRDKTQSSAEVDLLLVSGRFLIPVEVKSGATGSLKSLHQFIEAAGHPVAIRVYGGKFRIEKTQTPGGHPYTLLNVPYYAATMPPEYANWLVEG